MEAVAQTDPTPKSANAVSSPGWEVSQEIELILHPPHFHGVENRIRELLDRRGVGILAASPYSEEQSQQWLVVVDDGERAAAVLKEAGMPCETETVLVVEAPLRPAFIARLGAVLRGVGIGIQYSYISLRGQSRVTAVFKTTDETRALNTLADQLCEVFI